MILALALFSCNGDDEPGTTPTADTGTVDLSVEDVFIQTLYDPIDILYVLDPTWQEGLTNTLDALEKGYEALLLADPDWRIGVLSSDTSANQYRGIIKGIHETWPPQEDAFLVAGPGPSNVREAIYTAFDERYERNAKFLREDGDLYIIVVTNKPDQTPANIISQDDFIDWLAALEHTRTVRIGALTISSPNVVNFWEDLSEQTGGTTFDVGSFRRAVETLTLDAIGQTSVFQLSAIPAEPPQEVTVVYREHPEVYAIDEGFEYIAATNTIEFIDVLPQPGAQIRVSYERIDLGTTPTTPGDSGQDTGEGSASR